MFQLGKESQETLNNFCKDESCLEGEKNDNESMRDVLKEREKKKEELETGKQ